MSSCEENKPKNNTNYDKEKLLQINRHLLEEEEHLIESYTDRLQADVKKTGTGLRYYLVSEGHGAQPKEGNTVRIQYKIKRLSGEVLYASEENSYKSFLIGKDEIESGIHEGLQLMKTGGKSNFIVPSHLAFGFSGDRNKIPPSTPLIYEIYLLGIE